MKNSFSKSMGILCCILTFTVCIHSIFAEEKEKAHKRIIVQFRESSMTNYFGQYVFGQEVKASPQPHRMKQVTRDSIIGKMKERSKHPSSSKFARLKELMVFEYDDVSDLDFSEILKELNDNPYIEYAEEDHEIHGAYSPTDSYYSMEWDMPRISADLAWEYTQGSADVIVAVLDTGVDYTHPDLYQNIVPGYDFVNDDDDPYDDSYDSYHGTHVTGIIGARGNNSQGIAGTAWKVKIMPLKVLDNTVSGNIANSVEAIDYAIANGASIINASWGTTSNNTALSDAIMRAKDAGILFVAAAGNGGSDAVGDNNDTTPYYPASYDMDNIIAVASSNDATGAVEDLTATSNYGPVSVDLAAPGYLIYSTIGQNRYSQKSGTSMAAPHVTGAAALIKSVYPSITYQNIVNALIINVDAIPYLSGKVKSSGRLNVLKALLSIGTPALNIPAPENPPTDVPGQITDLLLSYKCAEGTTTIQQIKPNIRITNRNLSAITLPDITARYYYTKEGTAADIVAIDYSSISSSLISITPADGYFEVGFASGAGIIAEGAVIEIQLRMYKSDNSAYDQSNDYSFNNAFGDYAFYNKIPLYVQGSLVYGYGPDGPTPSPTSGSGETPGPTAVPTDTPTTPPSVSLAPTDAPTVTPVPTATPDPTVVPTATPGGLTPVPTESPTAPPTETMAPTADPTESVTTPPTETIVPTDTPINGCTCTALCDSRTAITVPFTYDGSGEFCWETGSIGSYVNSWNLDTLNVNGTTCTNVYTSSSSITAINGVYYVYYKAAYSYSHVEIK